MIYMLARKIPEDGGRWFTQEVDSDHGYFTSRKDAEKAAEGINAPARERYEKELARYNEQIEEYKRKDAEAKKLGFRAERSYGWRPDEPDEYVVEEIEEGKVS